MAETRLQRKRRQDAEFWGSLFKGSRLIQEAAARNRRVEKRKRAQFRKAKEGKDA